jgi:glycosyltransferase involved in cell wall biosynthesis
LPPLKRILGDKGAGILVESNEIEAFADAILALLDNRQLRAKMGKHGRECVEQMYNWEAESAKLVELYEMLLCRTR